MSILAPQIPLYTKISPKLVQNGVSQGMSNISPYSKVTGIIFDTNGKRKNGQTGSPAFDIDIEDFYQGLNNIDIYNNIFQNSGLGVIILKGTKFVRFFNNTVNYNTNPIYKGKVMSFGNGHDTQIFNNILRDVSVDLGRRDEMYGNTLFDVSVAFSGEGDTFRNHTNNYNTRLTSVAVDTDNANADYPTVSYVTDNIFTYDKPLSSTALIGLSDGGKIIFKNNIFDGGGNTVSNTQILVNAFSSSIVSKGYTDNIIFKNFIPALDYDNPLSWVVQDVNKLETDIGLSIRTGGARNALLSNSKAAWLDLQMTNFANTNTGEFFTYTIDNLVLNPVRSSFLIAGRFLVRAAIKDFNLLVKNSEFLINHQNSNFFNIQNNGTKVFINCFFKTAKLNSTQTVTSEFKFINCTFENIVFTNGILLYTYPDPNAPTYADNATALAALGDGYYYKDSTTGKFEVTIN
jgi:hypothetical protein